MLHKDQTILVTGAGGGIGREAAVLFAQEGGKVVVADLNLAAAESTVEIIESNGGQAVACAVDVSREEDISAMIDFTVSHFGGLNAAFNNAGISGKWDSSTSWIPRSGLVSRTLISMESSCA